MTISPHDPISLTISPAIDGLRISASSLRGTNAQRQQGDQQIHREGRQHRQQRRAANVALVSRPRGHDYRPLHADKHPQGDQHGVFDLLPYRHAQRQAAKIEAERIQLKGQGGERDKTPSGTSFASVATRLILAAVDTAQDQKVDDPQQNRRANDRLPGIPVAKQCQLRVSEETEPKRR